MYEQLLAFALAAAVIIVVPGPDMLLVFKNTVKAGRAGAFWTITGVLAGNAVLALAAALGLTVILMTSQTVFTVVKIAGGTYLVYLGVQGLRSWWVQRRQARHGLSAASPAAVVSVPGMTAVTGFRQGMLCNLLNPKVAVFFLALFPQFSLAPLEPLTQHIVLAALFWTMAALWYLALFGVLTAARRVLAAPTFRRRTEAISGVALTGLGIAVLARPGTV